MTAVALDKTGTLTKGKFSVSRILPANGVSEDALLSDAALCELRSSHPIAKSILERYSAKPDEALLTNYIEHAGQGTEATLKDNTKLLAGNRKLMDAFGIKLPISETSAGTAVLIAKKGIYEGSIEIADTLKETSASAIKELKALGVSRIVMLTGDAPQTAAQIAKEAGITEWKAGLLPQDKVAAVEELMAKKAPGEKLAFVGDGINDAPVIAGADIGIAMGGIGSDAAIEAADIVLMTDDLSKLPLGIRIARKTGMIVKQNIVFALGIKVLVLLLSLFGFASMWMAIFADVGVALLAVLNALRSMRVRR